MSHIDLFLLVIGAFLNSIYNRFHQDPELYGPLGGEVLDTHCKMKGCLYMRVSLQKGICTELSDTAPCYSPNCFPHC